MEQKDVDNITKKILAINDDPDKIHEFLCACANARSTVENKLHADTAQVICKATIKSLVNNIGI